MSTGQPDDPKKAESTENAPVEESTEDAATDSSVDEAPADKSLTETDDDPTQVEGSGAPEEVRSAEAGNEPAVEPGEPAATVAVEEPTGMELDVPGLTLGSGSPADESQVRAIPVIRGKTDRFGVALGTGRRKTAVARVRIQPGDGQLTINGRGLDEYFRVARDRRTVLAPLEMAGQASKVNIWVRVKGGGTTGQTGAIVLGIARALTALDPDLHHSLADGGYLTRDGRMVERKKYGLRKARRSFQFSKR